MPKKYQILVQSVQSEQIIRGFSTNWGLVIRGKEKREKKKEKFFSEEGVKGAGERSNQFDRWSQAPGWSAQARPLLGSDLVSEGRI